MLYECKFPPEEVMTSDGWMPLISDSDIDRQLIETPPYPVGETRIGVDVSGGSRNYLVVFI